MRIKIFLLLMIFVGLFNSVAWDGEEQNVTTITPDNIHNLSLLKTLTDESYRGNYRDSKQILFNYDDTLLVVLQIQPRRILIISAETGEIVSRLDYDNLAFDITIHPSRNIVALSDTGSPEFPYEDGRILIWDFENNITTTIEFTQTILSQITNPQITNPYERQAVSIEFSPDGEFLVASLKNNLVFWHTEDYSYFKTISNTLRGSGLWGEGYGLPITDISFSPDGDYVAVGTVADYALIYHVESSELFSIAPNLSDRRLAEPDGVSRVFLLNRDRLIFQSIQNLMLFDTFLQYIPFRLNNLSRDGVIINQDGSLIAHFCRDSETDSSSTAIDICFVVFRTGETIFRFELREVYSFTGMAFSNDYTLFAFSDGENGIQIWSISGN